MFEFVDKVVYINLDYRTDRRSQIESELFKYFSTEKVIRFKAIKGNPGAVGCSKSHIAILKMARDNGWKNVLVVEDDAMFTHVDQAYPVFETLSSQKFDVIVLGTTATFANPHTYKLHSGQTTTGYLVSSHYYETLLKNFEEGMNLLESTGDEGRYALDQCWKILQAKDNWFRVIPKLLIQRPSFSDNSGKYEDYSRNFDDIYM